VGACFGASVVVAVVCLEFLFVAVANVILGILWGGIWSLRSGMRLRTLFLSVLYRGLDALLLAGG
jgi:hypothetical protein